MPGKKKGGKKKGGKPKGGGDGGLPPPPDFSQNRQSALEALLSYRIQGKQEVIDVYSEESEVYKDKNYQQKQKNYTTKQEKLHHLNTLVQEAIEFEKKLNEAETVGREEVEKAMLEKLNWSRMANDELRKINETIMKEDEKLREAYEELKKLLKYKDETQHSHSQYIHTMKETMENWEAIERDLEDKLKIDIGIAKTQVDQRLVELSEQQKEKISERLLCTMDNDAKGEISDNIWLKQQISMLRIIESKLQEEINSLELRNLEVMENVYSCHRQELEGAQKLFSIPGRHSTPIKAGSSVSSLHTSSSQSKLASRQLDLGLLSVEGTKVPMRPVPQLVHLPPIEEQRHQGLPKLNWPVTGRMLKAITV